MVLGAIILYSGMEGVVIPLTTFIYLSSHGFVSLTHKYTQIHKYLLGKLSKEKQWKHFFLIYPTLKFKNNSSLGFGLMRHDLKIK